MFINSILPNWSEIGIFEQVFWIIAIPATVIFLILLILTVIGAETDAGVDATTDVDASLADGDIIPFQFLSLKNIVAFFTVFGWSGIGFINAGLETWLVILLSFACGFLMMVLMATLFYMMSKLAESGTLKMGNAIGKLGEVYLVIPGNRGGMGKVQLNVQGSLRTLDAITDDQENIPTSSIIQVLDVIDDQILLVKKQGR
jgi:membrane protein implicated in regulation of membrane protease activity